MVFVPRPRGASVLALPAWLLASFATAALAHGLIGLTGGGDAYAEHAHGAVAPVALAALSLVSALLRGPTRTPTADGSRTARHPALRG